VDWIGRRVEVRETRDKIEIQRDARNLVTHTRIAELYGHQEDAKVGYNPQEPGRPSHAYNSYFIANLRMVIRNRQKSVSDGAFPDFACIERPNRARDTGVSPDLRSGDSPR